MNDPQVKEVSAKGEIVWSWYARDHFYRLPFKDVYEEGWTHTNSATRLSNGDTLISLRNFNLTVEVNVQINRVVTTMAYEVEIMIALNCLDKVVGVHTGVHSPNQLGVLKYYEDKLKEITAVGAFPDVNTETIIGLKPDVVVFSSRQENLEKALGDAGIPVVIITITAPPDDILRTWGEAVGAQSAAENLLSARRAALDLISERLADVPVEQRAKVLVVSGPDATRIVGGSFFTTYIVEEAGCVNAAEEITTTGWNIAVSLEQIITWNPDIIIVNSAAAKGGTELKSAILQDPSLQQIAAVKNGRVYIEPVDTHFLFRQTTAHIGSLWLAKIAYPDQFGDIDIQNEMNEFWLEFYGRPFPGTVGDA
jgi:iron complex transport system substrate-binding protein